MSEKIQFSTRPSCNKRKTGLSVYIYYLILERMITNNSKICSSLTGRGINLRGKDIPISQVGLVNTNTQFIQGKLV